jgi:hypothetical protein
MDTVLLLLVILSFIPSCVIETLQEGQHVTCHTASGPLLSLLLLLLVSCFKPSCSA